MEDNEFKKLVKQFNMDITGVIHIGAHYGEEIQTYLDCGIEDMLLFEPQQEVFQVLLNNIPKNSKKIIPIRCALGEKTEFNVDMYIERANNGQSSSLLKPKLHLQHYPHIQFPDKNKVSIFTLDELMNRPPPTRPNMFKNKYNFINIDVQGYELKVFKGARKTLENIDYIYTEVNVAELYEGCPMVEDLDEFLAPYGFKRVYNKMFPQGWGDSLYCKEKK